MKSNQSPLLKIIFCFLATGAITGSGLAQDRLQDTLPRRPLWAPRLVPLPPCGAILKEGKLVAPGTGWAIVAEPPSDPAAGTDCTEERLFWTETNGRTWKDITPAERH